MRIFLSYAHDDSNWRRRVRKYLDALPGVQIWDDTSIPSGEEWSTLIETKMHTADGGLLLVSNAYLQRPYIRNTELPNFEALHNSGRPVWWLVIEKIVLRAYPFLEAIQAFPNPSSPLSSLHSEVEEEALLGRFAEELYNRIESIKLCPWVAEDLAFQGSFGKGWWVDAAKGGPEGIAEAMKLNVPPNTPFKPNLLPILSATFYTNLADHTYSFECGQSIVDDANMILRLYLAEKHDSNDAIVDFDSRNIIGAWARVISDANIKGGPVMISLLLSIFGRSKRMREIADYNLNSILLNGLR